MQTDISKEEEVRALFEFCKSEFGRLDVLVNNASYSSPVGWDVKPMEMNWAEWEKTIQVDLKGTMLCSHEAISVNGTSEIWKRSSTSHPALRFGVMFLHIYIQRQNVRLWGSRAHYQERSRLMFK